MINKLFCKMHRRPGPLHNIRGIGGVPVLFMAVAGLFSARAFGSAPD